MQYSWDFQTVWRHADVLLDGVVGTLALTASALALALPFGFVLAAMRMAPLRVLSVPAVLYIDLFRTSPALVLVVWFYFAFPILVGVNMDAYAAALLAIGLQSAAYMAEVFRGGMQSIGKGQWEAARAIGLGTTDTVRFVILPQAVRRMVPVFMIRFAELIKATTLAASIAYGETVYRASELSAQTYRPLEVFTTVAAIFFVIIFGIGQVASWLERRYLQENDPPPLNWSTLKYVFWQTGGPQCRRSAISPKRSSRSCARSMCWSRRGNPLPMRSARSA